MGYVTDQAGGMRESVDQAKMLQQPLQPVCVESGHSSAGDKGCPQAGPSPIFQFGRIILGKIIWDQISGERHSYRCPALRSRPAFPFYVLNREWPKGSIGTLVRVYPASHFSYCWEYR